jgi:hypothetical protein
MIKEIEITCPPGQQEDEGALKGIAASALKIAPNKITGFKILKRSIDARGRKVLYRIICRFAMH